PSTRINPFLPNLFTLSPSFVPCACTSRTPSGASNVARLRRPAPEYYSTMGIVQSRHGPLSNRITVAARASLEAALGRQVAGPVLPRDEVEPGVRVGGRVEMGAVPVEKHLEHRQESLQGRLRVDREVEVLVVNRPQRDR